MDTIIPPITRAKIFELFRPLWHDYYEEFYQEVDDYYGPHLRQAANIADSFVDLKGNNYGV